MLRKLGMVVGLLTTAFCGSAAHAQVPLQSIRDLLDHPTGQAVTILFVGDSHVAAFGVDNPHGFVTFLAQQLAAYYPGYQINLTNRRAGTGDRVNQGNPDCRPSTDNSTPNDALTTATYNAGAPYTLNIIRDGISANNAYRLLARMSGNPFPNGDAMLAGISPDAVVVLVGGNDSMFDPTQAEDASLACYPSSFTPDGLGRAVDLKIHGESPGDFGAALGAVVDKLHGVTPNVVLMSPMWVPGLNALQPADTASSFQNYVAQVRSVAAAKGTGLIDLYNWMDVDPRTAMTSADMNCTSSGAGIALNRSNLTDCVHFSSVGNYQVALGVLGLGFGLKDYRNGWWYDPSQPGVGVFFESQKGYTLMRVFMYGSDGQPAAYSTPPGAALNDGYVLETQQLLNWTAGGANGATANPIGVARMVFTTGSESDWRQTSGPNAADNPDQSGNAMRAAGLALVTNGGGYNFYELTRFPLASNPPHPDPIAAGLPDTGWWTACNTLARDYAIETAGGTFYGAYTTFDSGGTLRWFAILANGSANQPWQGSVQEYFGGETLGGAFMPPNTAAQDGPGIFSTAAPSPNPGDCGQATINLPPGALGGNFSLTRIQLYPQ